MSTAREIELTAAAAETRFAIVRAQLTAQLQVSMWRARSRIAWAWRCFEIQRQGQLLLTYRKD